MTTSTIKCSLNGMTWINRHVTDEVLAILFAHKDETGMTIEIVDNEDEDSNISRISIDYVVKHIVRA